MSSATVFPIARACILIRRCEEHFARQGWMTDGPVESLAPEARLLLDLREYLRQANIPDAPVSQAADYIGNFMAGKSLAADLIEAALTIAGTGYEADRAAIQARYRGRGVPQMDFMAPYFERLQAEPELGDGFRAALGSHLVACGNAGDTPDGLRRLTFEDYMGGPGTEYVAEEGASDTPEPASPIPDRGRDLPALLARLDIYVDATEHIPHGKGDADAVFPIMHSGTGFPAGVWCLLGQVREAQERGDTETTLRLLDRKSVV